MKEVDVLVAATHRRWVAEDLSRQDIVPVVLDHGLDAPILDGLTAAWWTPTEHAAKLLHAGLRLDLSAPGPYFLSNLDKSLTGRHIWTGTLTKLFERKPTSGWCKIAEAKVEALPAQWWDDTFAFALAAINARLPMDSIVQVCEKGLEIDEEHRMYILGEVVVATSPYLLHGETWDEGWRDMMVTPMAWWNSDEAVDFAQDVVDRLGLLQPRAYVLDVALLTNGSWVVVEANPAWSSAFYGCSIPRVVRTIIQSSAGIREGTAPSRHGAFSWSPDPYLLEYASKRRPLQLSEPTWRDRLGR